MDNSEPVRGFLDTAFHQKQAIKAFELYCGEPYVQHNTHAPAGGAASARYLESFVNGFPELSIDLKRVLVDGDFVVTHSLIKLRHADRGAVAMDIFRVRDGRIVEHWDAVADIPENPTNPPF
ncbi:nuclear transport factor 2 family protein [Fodinicola acaciae]|uniref:nuclear transport factor 2 family protein n=1 Tax=Fodinicola acaciae TaxID=2681555 RepID=UPI0013CFBDDD|nr:nuclear transport factor 2 family protein [Fodinicola acaciae]